MEDYLNDVNASSEQIVDAQPEAPETSEVAEVESVVEVAKPQQTAERKTHDSRQQEDRQETRLTH